MGKAAWLTGDRFERKQSEFRDQASIDERHHLYVSYACPWAHRTLIARALLDIPVTVDVVDWAMEPDGSWKFNPAVDGATADTQTGSSNLQQIYKASDPDFHGIGTVPVLFDKKTKRIVNNESREIIRMFSRRNPKMLPSDLEDAVDAMIDANYETINNGVYKAGFASTQEAYDEAITPMFARLDELEAHLTHRDWLVGDGRGTLTEADICLFTTLLRWDPVYAIHFKCVRRIKDYPHLHAFVARFRALPGVASTIRMDHIVNHYYRSHTRINPFGIVPRVGASMA